jgi:GntR family transcriptional regulator
MSTLFVNVPSEAETLHGVLVSTVLRRVAAGALKPGDPVPSVRDLAEGLGVNKMTVSKAYARLVADGVLARRRGLGMVVSQRQGARSVAERVAMLAPAIGRLAREAAELDLAPDDLAPQVVAMFRSS